MEQSECNVDVMWNIVEQCGCFVDVMWNIVEECGCFVEQCECNVDPPNLHISRSPLPSLVSHLKICDCGCNVDLPHLHIDN